MAERPPDTESSSRQRLRAVVRGAVQGVGFRPFVFRLASQLALNGWVINSSHGVFVEVEGPAARLSEFLARLHSDKPAPSFIQSLESSWLDPVGYEGFEIRESQDEGAPTVLVLPDIALCDECRREIFDPTNRRYRYPFTNCTNCGPRYSIIESLPYDRAGTTMRGFAMCPDCEREYRDPRDRRFHAQPNACPVCGPHLELWDADGNLMQARDAALLRAADAIRAGGIVAVKGLGGFHLMVDARNSRAVAELRRRKRREEKPLAVMVGSVDAARNLCDVDRLEERLLISPESPIVLLRRLREPDTEKVCELVAPGNPTLGLMLPYTPLHHLLVAELGFPVVATSGNLSDEPICTDEKEATERLAGIADLFLVHDRPIARHVDDSIVRVMMGREMVLRRARGYAPLPVTLSGVVDIPGPTVLAVGAHLKNVVAASVGRDVFVSQHIGDLETSQASTAFESVITSLGDLYRLQPEIVACDDHPDYHSTRHARATGLPVVSVQHHAAHVYSCMAENGLSGPVLGVAWDGTGYGSDGTVWGGEFLSIPDASSAGAAARDFVRSAHLRTFRLPGGDAAVREPRRSALGVLFESIGDGVAKRTDLSSVAAFDEHEIRLLCSMLRKGLNAPVTSSAGRLFDAIASIVGLAQHSRHEGQAAMQLEFALDGVSTDESYPFEIILPESESAPAVLNWMPMITRIMDDVMCGVRAGVISARTHNALVEMIVTVARWCGIEHVALSGGCFQNRYLTERAVHRLRQEGFRPYWHQRVPPNDGGIALGQVAVAMRRRAAGR